MVLVLFCDLLKDDDGNPWSEHEGPSEDFWKKVQSSLVSHSSNESQPQKQKVGHQHLLKNFIVTAVVEHFLPILSKNGA